LRASSSVRRSSRSAPTRCARRRRIRAGNIRERRNVVFETLVYKRAGICATKSARSSVAE
jgi:hypothetical protein